MRITYLISLFLFCTIVGRTENLGKNSEIPRAINLNLKTCPDVIKGIYLKEDLKTHIKKFEGKLSNHPSDIGGLTNQGITWGTFIRLSSELHYPATRRVFYEMPDSVWDKVFDAHWNTFDRVEDAKLKAFLTEYIWGAGSYANTNINTCLHNINPAHPVYPYIDERTISELNMYDAELLLPYLMKYRKVKMIELNSYKVFSRGWNRRDDSLVVLLGKY